MTTSIDGLLLLLVHRTRTTAESSTFFVQVPCHANQGREVSSDNLKTGSYYVPVVISVSNMLDLAGRKFLGKIPFLSSFLFL